MKINLVTFFVIFLLSNQLIAQKSYTVSGYVKDSSSGEDLIYANIIDGKTQKGVTTNYYGYYTFTCLDSVVELNYSYIGHISKKIKLRLCTDTVVNINLLQQNLLEEVLVESKKDDFVVRTEPMGGYLLNVEQLKSMPVVFGETDIMKSIQNLPGIQSGKEGTAGFHVRGGSPDQNLILLDGIPLYNANHLFGFFSAFNSDAINSVKIYKDGMPARYGGRLSSVVDIYMKEGNTNELKVNASIGLIASKLTVEGPIVKSKASFMVSARRTYMGAVLNEIQDGDFGRYHFSDFCAKINYSISQKNKLYLSLYTGNDKSKKEESSSYHFSETESEHESTYKFGWSTKTSALRWNSVLSPRIFMNTSLAFSNYNYYNRDFGNSKTLYFSENKRYQSSYLDEQSSGIMDFIVKNKLDYKAHKHNVSFGSQYIRHIFSPNHSLKNHKSEKYDFFNIDTVYNAKKIKADDFQVYLEDDFVLISDLRLNIGVNYSFFLVNSKIYHAIEPRILANYKFDRFGIKSSYTKNSQNIHLLTNTSIGMPTDLWIPPTEKIKPQSGEHYNLGVYSIFDRVNFGLDVYYRTMKNMITYKEGAFYGTIKNDWQDVVVQGKGEAYGLDFFAKYSNNKFDFYLAYSLSKSNRQFNEVNHGKAFPYRFDRTHDITISGKYKINKNISFSASWYYMTGEAITLTTKKVLPVFMVTSEHYRDQSYSVLDENKIAEIAKMSGLTIKEIEETEREMKLNRPYNQLQIPYFKHRNNYRMPAYHRLDISFLFEKQKKHFLRTWGLGVYNVYNKQNPFFYSIEKETTYSSLFQKTELKQTVLFPILPYVTYHIKF